ncbi:MAG TPA: phosphoenolpyruvate--protein phosphotransferase [Gemmatimonadales bacterium]|nr:phosphoenolpyruvate--protein phosphotransferase [Gemmatimonadales bacterium]
MPHRVIKGIAVSPGVAVGPALVVRWEAPVVPDVSIRPDQVAAEAKRLDAAMAYARERITRSRDRAAERAGEEEARIFDAQLMMLEDHDLRAGVDRLVRENHFSAERAFQLKMLEWRGLWTTTGSATLRERLADLTDVEILVLSHLMGVEEPTLEHASAEAPVVLVARDLTPALTVQLDRDAVLAIACEEGTRTSHAAILAHSIGIPAVMALSEVLDRVTTGDTVVLDGWAGTLQVQPSEATVDAARRRDRQRRELERDLEAGSELPAQTTDGTVLAVRANLDLPEELEAALRHRAEGIGLMRTEFLVAGRGQMPTEDEQAELYRRIGTAFAPHPVVVRSFDLGGDKFPAPFKRVGEGNPMLGWRAIRVCLDQPEIFRPQIRAILRAAAHAKLKMMLPLVTRVDEVLRTREMVAEEARALHKSGVEAAASVPIGIMVETPAAAIVADRLAEVSDFLSVGTNDLVQYTLAVDRGNARLAERFSPHHPAVLRLLRNVARAAKTARREVSVCGEMASDPVSVYLLVGLGYRVLSAASPSLPMVKWMVRQISARDAASCAEGALELPTTDEVNAFVLRTVGSVVDLRLLDPSSPLPARARRASLRR